MEYQKCKCGSEETYISFAGDTCCYPCFQVLKKKKPVVAPDLWAYVRPYSEGVAVKINGEIKKYFSKYEDYAHTDAKNYANKLNTAERLL